VSAEPLDATVRDIADIEEAFVARWSLFARWPGAHLLDESGVLRFETPLRKLPYNGVIRTTIEERADEAIARVIDSYMANRADLLWLDHPSARPHGLGDLLAANGLKASRAPPACRWTTTHGNPRRPTAPPASCSARPPTSTTCAWGPGERHDRAQHHDHPCDHQDAPTTTTTASPTTAPPPTPSVIAGLTVDGVQLNLADQGWVCGPAAEQSSPGYVISACYEPPGVTLARHDRRRSLSPCSPHDRMQVAGEPVIELWPRRVAAISTGFSTERTKTGRYGTKSVVI
jgi:hypothetical protein